MELIEANELVQNSIRSLAMLVETVRQEQIDKVVGVNEPMQDHLAECYVGCTLYEGTDIGDCCDFLKHVADGLNEAAEHSVLQAEQRLNGTEGMIVDMLEGMVVNCYEREYGAAAKEILVCLKQMRTTGCMTEKEFVTQAMEMVRRVCGKHGVRLSDEKLSIQELYFISWLKRVFRQEYII